jgi:hypothetical protein
MLVIRINNIILKISTKIENFKLQELVKITSNINKINIIDMTSEELNIIK